MHQDKKQAYPSQKSSVSHQTEHRAMQKDCLSNVIQFSRVINQLYFPPSPQKDSIFEQAKGNKTKWHEFSLLPWIAQFSLPFWNRHFVVVVFHVFMTIFVVFSFFVIWFMASEMRIFGKRIYEEKSSDCKIWYENVRKTRNLK